MTRLSRPVPDAALTQEPGLMGYGERCYEIIRSIDSNTTEISEHFLARAAGRMIEEAVELALSYGITADKLLGHVVDALHNEAKKRHCFPSEIVQLEKHEECVAELADMTIQIDYLRSLIGARADEIDHAANLKISRMKEAAALGEAVIIDGLFYRRSARL